MDIKALLDELDTFDAPTVCNGLELIDNSYRLKGYGRPGMMLRRGRISQYPVLQSLLRSVL